MNQFHFQDEEALKAQHISDEEVRKVIALYAQEQKEREERRAQPTVQAMAEGLGIPTEEVVRLLAEVRASETAVQRQQMVVPVHERQRHRRWLLALIGAALTMFIWLALRSIGTPLEAPATVATTENGYVRNADGSYVYNGTEGHYERNADGSVIYDSPKGHYERHADGSLKITTAEGTYTRNADGSKEIRGPGGFFIHRADGSEVRQGVPPTVKPPDPPPGLILPEVP